jgi:LuxR family maltose regulon positive regulatory protein
VKLVLPRLPASHVRRPALERLLQEAEQRRLTLIVAGAGFGKSTLAASVAIERGWSWYRADGADISPPAFAQGLSDALHLELPTEPFAAGAADALGNALAEALDEKLHEDVVLVLDDVHELGSEESARVLETLVRLGPPELHLVLCTREGLPFSIERLHGQGDVLEIDASMLPFSHEETLRMIGSPTELAPRIQDLTAGWPVAVQLAAAASASSATASRFRRRSGSRRRLATCSRSSPRAVGTQ